MFRPVAGTCVTSTEVVTVLLAYDMKLRRPGCVIVQAGMGGDPRIAEKFPTKSWLLAPTSAMKVYRLTDVQLAQAVELAEIEHGKV